MAARSRGGTTRWLDILRRITRTPSCHGTTVIEWLHQFNPMASQEELRGLLWPDALQRDDALKPTKALPPAASPLESFSAS